MFGSLGGTDGADVAATPMTTRYQSRLGSPNEPMIPDGTGGDSQVETHSQAKARPVANPSSAATSPPANETTM
jgi:hypothetical protein